MFPLNWNRHCWFVWLFYQIVYFITLWFRYFRGLLFSLKKLFRCLFFLCTLLAWVVCYLQKARKTDRMTEWLAKKWSLTKNTKYSCFNQGFQWHIAGQNRSDEKEEKCHFKSSEWQMNFCIRSVIYGLKKNVSILKFLNLWNFDFKHR